VNLNDFSKVIYSAGGRAFIVGGAVRDKLMGLKPKDLDLMVTGLSVDDFLSLFPDAILSGKDFAVFNVRIDGKLTDVALARTDKKNGVGHKGFTVFTDKSLTVADDLGRRDITINAIAIDLHDNTLIDPFNGADDIRNGVIRHVSDAFKDDPLRVFRVARFASRFNFKVHDDTIKLMNSMKGDLITLHPNRVSNDFLLALQTDNPQKFFQVLRDADVLDVFFKPIADLIGVVQNPIHHPEGDAFVHTMLVLQASAKLSKRLDVRFSALVHDLGKAVTPQSVLPAHHNHDANGVDIVAKFADDLLLPKKLKLAGMFATKQHMKMHILDKMKKLKVVDLVNDAHKNPLGVKGLSILAIADARGKGDMSVKHNNAISFMKVAPIVLSIKADTSLSISRIADDKRIRSAKAIADMF
jgi:tRNA nucleotidyltransferase (CCA-adding enzyme)